MHNIARMKKHIQLLEKLKRDQRQVMEAQIDLTSRRQKFWEEYSSRSETYKTKQNQLKRDFEEHAKKMDLLRARFENRRQNETGGRFAA